MDKDSIEPLENLLDKVRDIDGFPIAKDEDILELSDSPYYTACPNPYIKQFIEEYGKPYDPENDDYDRKPFVGDVSEGKNDSIYRAHSYHTKVPHKAIMKFIEHYTKPGDIVFDGFCGSGMTGIAAQMTGRFSILSDLAPSASFIAYNYNKSVNYNNANKISTFLSMLKQKYRWMFETNHSEGAINTRTGDVVKKSSDKKGIINYTVWSDVLICPYCNNEYTFWDAAIKEKIKNRFLCPYCGAEISKTECERKMELKFDTSLKEKVKQAKQIPVLINYSIENKRFEKKLDKEDIELISRIENMEIPYWFPIKKLPSGYNTLQPIKSHGFKYVHNFFTKRNLWILSELWEQLKASNSLFLLTSSIINLSKLYRFRTNRKGGSVSGTLYIPSTFQENNPINVIERKLQDYTYYLKSYVIIQSTQSITSLSNVSLNSVDYIFTDPPFGDNLMYSELNFIWESWLKVFTNNKPEAIVNKTQNKSLEEYTELMTKAFKEMYRVLKPNRWMTVVFHNSKASVWNAIQESITRAGFIIAQVTTMDKKQGSFKQVTSAGAVKNDLIINAYKPKKEFEEKFLKNAGEGMEVEFVTQQLYHLPVETNIERTEKMLYSKMLAHYVENGFKIKYNATNFYSLLHGNFVEMDGYWFLEDQVDEYYDWKSSLKLDEVKDIKKGNQVLFVVDEKSALTWLYSFLNEPKEYGEIYTNYEKIATTTEDVIPELREMLDNNFILEDGKYRRPQTKEERAKIDRNKEKEFDRAWKDLLNRAKSSNRKIKNVRREALIHGFTKCYQEENYEDILTVADTLYTSTLESSGYIMDFVDIARIKLGG